MAKKEKKKRSKTFETVETVVTALLLAIVIRATVAEARYIPSDSMVPTLIKKDRLVVEKISNYVSKPSRFDIVVFYPPLSAESEISFYTSFSKNITSDDLETIQTYNKENTPESNFFNKSIKWLGFTTQNAYIKRIIALPGETISIKDGDVFIDGKKIDDSEFINEKPSYNMSGYKIPEGHVFVLGDNRNNSKDSHAWGPLPIKNIIGYASIRFWPLKRIGPIIKLEEEKLSWSSMKKEKINY